MSATSQDEGAIDASIVLGVRNVSKRYGTIRALDAVTVSVHRGESLALLGANGAGKSTLVRVLTGAITPDTGEVIVDGRIERLPSVRATRRHGIAYVPQELTVAPDLTVAENVLAGGWDHRAGVIRRRASRARVERACEQIGLNVSPGTLVARLGPAERRLVMIARALVMVPNTMILDEPTAALADREAERIVSVLSELGRRGMSLVYISHRMGEIARICGSVVVLRDGHVVMEAPASPESVRRAVEVGFAGGTDSAPDSPHESPAEPAGEVPQTALRCSGLRNRALNGASFDVSVGEIVGLAGLLGSGRTEILRAAAGADPITAGEIEVLGRPMHFRSPAQAIAAGVALLPEDRRNQGALLGLTIRENLVMPAIPATRGGWLRRRAERRLAEETVARFGIKCESPEALLQTLSGGNQQKVILARWLVTGARVLLLDEPTAGIDVVAKREIMSLVTDVVREGRAAIIVSSELAELCEFCDRIYVVRNGAVRDVVDGTISVGELAQLCGEPALTEVPSA
jgi:ABC-type sugar transport system ATPase subunit